MWKAPAFSDAQLAAGFAVSAGSAGISKPLQPRQRTTHTDEEWHLVLLINLGSPPGGVMSAPAGHILPIRTQAHNKTKHRPKALAGPRLAVTASRPA
ncbi:hypothetical protein WJX73_000562 [Symbiochloris irregularis]|uniref:Uncharacterized protein n=1 Tax=Symbiochloris irregularis TaxID=706552 RepID=A0AAW1PXE4_9CHLO